MIQPCRKPFPKIHVSEKVMIFVFKNNLNKRGIFILSIEYSVLRISAMVCSLLTHRLMSSYQLYTVKNYCKLCFCTLTKLANYFVNQGFLQNIRQYITISEYDKSSLVYSTNCLLNIPNYLSNLKKKTFPNYLFIKHIKLNLFSPSNCITLKLIKSYKKYILTIFYKIFGI